MADPERDFLDDMADASAPAATPEADEPTEVQPAPEPAVTVEEPVTPEPEATTAPEVEKDKTVPLPALLAEREKRQALERQLAELKQQPQQTMPEFYEAPEQHLQLVEQRATQRLHAALEEQAKAVYPDYDDMAAKAIEAAQGNPLLAQQVLTAPNPALALYQLGKKTAELAQMQDPEAYRAKIEAEVRAKVEAEFAAKAAEKEKAAAAVPPDLSQARNAAGKFATAAPSPVDELFPR